MNELWKSDEIFPNRRLFQESQQAVPGKKLDKPGDLEKSITIRRLLAALGGLGSKHSRNNFFKKLENTHKKDNRTQIKQKLKYLLPSSLPYSLIIQ